MPTISNVSAGKPRVAGAVYRAPLGTTLPTDASSALDAAFKDMGFISEDGVVNSNSPESENIKDWGGRTVLVVSTDKPDTFKLTFIEATNANVLETVYGANNVTVDNQNNTITVRANADELSEFAYVIDMALRDGGLRRIVIPDGQLSEVGDITYKSDEAIGYETTISALPDASGNNHYEYTKLAS